MAGSQPEIIRWSRYVANIYARFAANHHLIRQHTYLSEAHVGIAVESALIDLNRMMEFHKTPQPDRHKYAGFLSKWIAKIRPIQINNPDQATTTPVNPHSPTLTAVNAAFAFLVFAGLLQKKAPLSIIQHLEYWYQYRDERGEVLSMIAFLCEQSAS